MKQIAKKFFSVIAILISVAAFAFADDALILSTSGTVEIGNNGKWRTAQRGTVVHEGEVISTGFKSEALVRFKDSTMKLSPLTQITLEQLVSNDTRDKVSVYLSTGQVRSNVQHTTNKRVSYTVRNPVAVASVRGTDFSMNSSNVIRVYRGLVAVSPAYRFDPKKYGISNPVKTESEQAVSETTTETDSENNNEDKYYRDDRDFFQVPETVFVSKGQKTDFSEWGSSKIPTQPKEVSTETNEQFTEGFNTNAENESVNPTNNESSGTENKVKTGKLKINIKLED